MHLCKNHWYNPKQPLGNVLRLYRFASILCVLRAKNLNLTIFWNSNHRLVCYCMYNTHHTWINDWKTVLARASEKERPNPLKRQHDTTSFVKLSKSQQTTHTRILRLFFWDYFWQHFTQFALKSQQNETHDVPIYVYGYLYGTICRTHIVLIYYAV